MTKEDEAFKHAQKIGAVEWQEPQDPKEKQKEQIIITGIVVGSVAWVLFGAAGFPGTGFCAMMGVAFAFYLVSEAV